MNITDPNIGSRPISAKELTERAKQFKWNPLIDFKYWARAADAIHHEGQVCLREGNLPKAYLLLFRYSTLVLEFLTKHPDAKTPEARKALKPLQKRVPRVIEILETLRPEVEESYDRWMKATAAQRDSEKNASFTATSPYARHAANDPALSWSYASPANILDAGDYQDLAVDLARKEMRRRRRAAVVLEEEDYRRSGTRQAEARAVQQYMNDDEMRRQMEATRRQLDMAQEYRRGHVEYEEAVRPSAYRYPSISRSSPLPYERPSSRGRVDGPRPQPPRPPKERHADRSPVKPPPSHKEDSYMDVEPPTSLPPRPDKEPLSSSQFRHHSPAQDEAPARPPKTAAEPAPQKRVVFKPAAYLENGDPIRPVFLPRKLRQKFLEIASENTRRGLEMCGMLCGTTVNNALFISHLVIPEQRCTSDTCDTENESALFEYCMDNDLITIGWIHTHPTQTCFMSSRDLHTQAGHQVMMPEGIAIVCAPQFEPSYGIFRLTNPPGLPHVLACQRTETFHPHDVDNLYVDAGHPQGHVYESAALEFEVRDLRPGY